MYTFNSDVITVLLGIEKEFGGDITIDELLKMANVDKKGIAEVKFTIRGVYRYAYELTGETYQNWGLNKIQLEARLNEWVELFNHIVDKIFKLACL